MARGILDGRWTCDPCPLLCSCGEMVHWLRRGRMYMLPPNHTCKYKTAQDDQVRTIRAEETVSRVTEGEAARRLREANGGPCGRGWLEER